MGGRTSALALAFTLCGLVSCREERGACSGEAGRLCLRVLPPAGAAPDALRLRLSSAAGPTEELLSDGVRGAFEARGAYVLELAPASAPAALTGQIIGLRGQAEAGRGEVSYAPGDPQPVLVQLAGAGSDMGETGPYISEVLPALGPTSGGTQLTVLGGPFAPGPSLAVQVGAAQATQLSWVNAGKLTALLPPGPHGPAALRVLSGDGRLSQPFTGFSYYYGVVEFASPGAPPVVGRPAGLAAGDFDGDGKNDVFLLGDNGWSQVAFAIPGQQVVARSRQLTMATSGVAVAAGRLDGDGLSDAVVATQDELRVLLGQASRDLRELPAFAAGLRPLSLRLGRFNDDSALDLAVLQAATPARITIYLGKGDGTFVKGPELDTLTGAMALAVGDLEGDRRDDLAVLSSNGTVALHRGLAGGGFERLPNRATGSAPTDVHLGDVNGDGALDLLLSVGAGVQLYLTDARRQLGTTPVLLPAGGGPSALGTGDFNGDGRGDIAVANRQDGTFLVHLGQGEERFTPLSKRTGTPKEPHRLLVGDFDGDGKDDVAIGSAVDLDLHIYYNQAR